MRDRHGLPNQAVEMRCGSNALGRAAGALDWGGTKSNCVGGTILIIPISVDHGVTATLDNSLNFRDRPMFLHCVFIAGSGALPGGASERVIYQLELNAVAAPELYLNTGFYTAAGWDGSTAPNGTNHYAYTQTLKRSDITTLDTSLQIYADSTSGFLKIKNSHASQIYSGVLFAIIGEQTGKRSSVP